MSEWIRIEAVAEVLRAGKENDSGLISPDDAREIAKQLARDAVYGTFGELPDFWSQLWDRPVKELVQGSGRAQGKELRIQLKLAADLYDVEVGGLQHLMGVLCGDLFYLQMPAYTFKDFIVTGVELPKRMEDRISKTYREGRAHNIAEIRKSFGLADLEPLLAFSLKPRVGLSQKALRDVTLGVLRSGFHVVELDTRNLSLDTTQIKNLIDLAKEAVDVGKGDRVTRFSPNLSVAAPKAIELSQEFAQASTPPCVVKIDGGLDGLSTVQALRMDSGKASNSVVTCYPLLRNLLRTKVPPDLFIRLLAMSGVDIIYPGGSPNVGGGNRRLDAAEESAIASAVERYRGFEESGWPMVTLAGGIYAGQLHALYELVGPKVAYFLGGAVSLHHDGPIEGARLCRKVVNQSIERAEKARGAGRTRAIQDLDQDLIREVEAAYVVPPGADNNMFRYTSAAQLLAQVDVPRW